MSVFTRGILRGIGFALTIVFIICAVLGLAALFFDINDAVLEVFSVVILGAAAYSAAHRSTQINRSQGMKQGFLCGAVLFLTALLFSAAFSQLTLSEMAGIKAAVCLVFGIVGGVVGINTKMTER